VVSVVARAEVAVLTWPSAALIAGALSLTVPADRPLVAVCNAANAVLTCSMAGCRAAVAEAVALSRLLLTAATAELTAAVPSCRGLTLARASSEDFRAAASAQADDVAADVADDEDDEDELVWLVEGLDPPVVVPLQAARALSRAAARIARAARRCRGNAGMVPSS
jgi:hypothetical protein